MACVCNAHQLTPDGYDPDDLYARYLAARADAEGESTKAILASLRQLEGTN